MAIDEKQLFDAVELEMSPAFRSRLEQELVAAAQPGVKDAVQLEISPAFRGRLEQELVAAAQPEAKEEVMVKVVEHGVGPRGDDGDSVRTGDPTSSGHRRMKVVLAAAASIALIAALAVVIINHQSEPVAVDTSHDPEIAKAAIIEPSDLGFSWSVTHMWGDLTSRSIAESAATVPECEPYLDDAFDTAGRQAVTAGRQFGIRGSELTTWIITQWVYIFPSEKAASQAMDKIAEPGFQPCLDHVFRRMYGNSQASRLDPLPVAPHGDRQIVIGQHLVFGAPPPDGIPVDTMNVWVQIGRAVVFVDPSTDTHDSLDPEGRIERAVSAATDALQAALDNAPS